MKIMVIFFQFGRDRFGIMLQELGFGGVSMAAHETSPLSPADPEDRPTSPRCLNERQRSRSLKGFDDTEQNQSLQNAPKVDPFADLKVHP